MKTISKRSGFFIFIYSDMLNEIEDDIRYFKLHESIEEYSIGDEVIVNGKIDNRTFDNYLCKVIRIEKDNILIEPLEDHHDGYGTTQWYVGREDIVSLDNNRKNKPIRIRWYSRGKLEESSTGISKPFGVKIQLENMNNVKDFNSFVNEEYMYRHDPSTKTERYEKQRQYFIRQITKLDQGKSKEELEKMSIEDLGKLLNKIKKEM